MKTFLFIFAHILLLFSCSSYTNYEDFKERTDSTKVVFQDNVQECEKLGYLQASRSEGSKRAGEILIDKRKYFMSCMDRKGWISKATN
jgi:hypothetical protein